jgi:thioesterase domain-containing protein
MFGFVYPDQDRDPPPALTIPELATRYVAAARRVQPSGPYCLIGYSLGGNIAYEMARQLRADGERIALLVLIDSPTPDGLTRGLTRLARKLSEHLGILSNEPLSAWPAYFWRALVKDAKRRVAKLSPPEKPAAVPAAVSRAHRARIRVDQALCRALETYVPPDYDGSIKLFRCIGGASARWTLRHQGWGGRARGGVEIFDLPSIHYEAIGEPVAALIAALMTSWLEQTDA